MYKVIKFNKPVPYQAALDLQMKAFEKVNNKEYQGILLLLQHEPAYTIGTGGGWDNLLYPKEYFESRNIDIVETKRGGNITFHGPGQLVVYPVLDLSELKKDIHWFISSLEECVIQVLTLYGLQGTRKPEYRGVWLEDKKIAAVGVAIRHWVTYHGLSFNINLDKKYFDWINPCGIKEFGICSLEDFVQGVSLDEVGNQLIKRFEEVFQIQIQEENLSFFTD